MQIWIWITFLAVISQSMRTAQAKNLKSVIGDFGASYVRFSYAIDKKTIKNGIDRIEKIIFEIK